jgi:hypothetical protein
VRARVAPLLLSLFALAVVSVPMLLLDIAASGADARLVPPLQTANLVSHVAALATLGVVVVAGRRMTRSWAYVVIAGFLQLAAIAGVELARFTYSSNHFLDPPDCVAERASPDGNRVAYLYRGGCVYSVYEGAHMGFFMKRVGPDLEACMPADGVLPIGLAWTPADAHAVVVDARGVPLTHWASFGFGAFH